MPLDNTSFDTGTVYLVGAGPGDPDLLTVKALRLLKSADVVVYDRLVSEEILDNVPAGATRIYVGKQDGHHHMSQTDINQLLVALARRNQAVVRLKGGDPFVFGRGSEEALVLARHGIPFEIVPGITAASGCTAYAGIPLTHRELSRRVMFVTGRCSSAEPPRIDASVAADEECTLVVYMGLRQLPDIVARLLQAGRPADTPVAVIENGSLPTQRRCITRLDSLLQAIESHGVQSPALVVIGRVVDLAQELDWFHSGTSFVEPTVVEIKQVAGI
jgi:uroporphyrin-III C-methyltransferase/precorrin-2 dehydrogenase/sirohydrochlorin ferrochelatase/uroporphyrin-III C-methyltransferase